MARIVLWALVALVVFSAPTMAQTIESATAKWPICNLGAKPIAPGPEPAEALVFRTDGGPVIMSQKGGRVAPVPDGSRRACVQGDGWGFEGSTLKPAVLPSGVGCRSAPGTGRRQAGASANGGTVARRRCCVLRS